MELTLDRFSQANGCTAGLLRVDGQFQCFTLEDGWTVVKVPGKSRIPEGHYQIRFREVESELTKRYQQRYPWFRWHLELQEVPDYQFVYIHIGNTADHSEGCILVGDNMNNNQAGPGFLGNSERAFHRLYDLIAEALAKGEEVWINVRSVERVEAP